MTTPTPEPVELEVHRGYLAILLAVLDGDCDQRAHDLLCRDDDPHFAVKVAHVLAHKMVGMVDDEYNEMRDDIAAELLGLAGEED